MPRQRFDTAPSRLHTASRRCRLDTTSCWHDDVFTPRRIWHGVVLTRRRVDMTSVFGMWPNWHDVVFVNGIVLARHQIDNAAYWQTIRLDTTPCWHGVVMARLRLDTVPSWHDAVLSWSRVGTTLF